MGRKANIGMETIFFILMVILMVAIIAFGIDKLFFVQKQMSTQEQISIQEQLKNDLNSCSDPLNKGSLKYITFNQNYFNSLCILNQSIINSINNINLRKELNLIYSTGENTVLLHTTYTNNQITNFNVISSFNITTTQYFCYIDKNNTQTFNLKYYCK